MINKFDLYRMITLKHALRLECKGMHRRGRSVYSIVKEEYGLRGNKQKVLAQFEEMIEQCREV
jgi:hypothetical protein